MNEKLESTRVSVREALQNLLDEHHSGDCECDRGVAPSAAHPGEPPLDSRPCVFCEARAALSLPAQTPPNADVIAAILSEGGVDPDSVSYLAVKVAETFDPSPSRAYQMRAALQEIATGEIAGEPNNHRDTLQIVREVARKALEALPAQTDNDIPDPGETPNAREIVERHAGAGSGFAKELLDREDAKAEPKDEEA